MKKLCLSIFLASLFYIFPCGLYAGTPDNKAPVVKRMIELLHVSPRPFDDQLCNDLLNDYLLSLDPDYLYFTTEDIDLIKKGTNIKAGVQGSDPRFLTVVTDLYHKRLLQADTIITAILQKPFDYSTDDSIVLDRKKSSYAATDKELKQRWFKYLKYETLHRITGISLLDSTATKESMLRKQSAEEKIVLKTEERQIKKTLNNPAGYEEYMAELFCNTLASEYDPHTEFFPLTARENFVAAVSGNGYSFGIQLGENDRREVEIAHLAPGSPAWKSGQLNQNDVLVQLQWEGDQPIDLEGSDPDEVGDLLDGDNHRLLNLTVHKANGTSVTVPLRKEKLKNDEDFVKSYVLNGENKIGYILLPGFYTEWETKAGSSCANDVAREVMKLKKENIKGLILDLRNNGGGSMEEAMDLAGIFIDEGTLGFSKEKSGKPHALKDPNRGTIYDGPLLVMVNGESASASEFVVGALQDYNRAIIVGSPTFGKATYQRIFPCDTTVDFTKDEEPKANSKNDFIKITLGRLYRVTGKSNQLNGAQPDILLPEAFEVFAEREPSLKHALLPDTVRRAFNFNQLPALPISALAAKSSNRVNASPGFGVIKQCSNLYKEMHDLKAGTMPIDFDSFLNMTKRYGAGALQLYHKLEQDSLRSFRAENFGIDKPRFALGGYESDANTYTLRGIMRDIYIDESFLILADYIKLTK